MTRVLFVCLGNICRSPMAECVFVGLLEERGLTDRYQVDSAGTSAYHAGEAPDPRTVEVLRRHGMPVRGRSRRVVSEDFSSFDVLFAMDGSNLRELLRQCPQQHEERVQRLLPDGLDVPDPYYGGADGFDRIHGMIRGALESWLDARHPA